MEDINTPRFWRSHLLPPPDSSSDLLLPPQFADSPNNPLNMPPQPDFRSQFGSSGPSGPMFNVEQLPVAPNQQQRLLAVTDTTPSGSRTQSPHPPGIVTPSHISSSVHVATNASAIGDSQQSRLDDQSMKAVEAQRLLYAAAQAVLYNQAALAAESSAAGATPIHNGDPGSMPRLAIRSPPDGRQSPKPDSFFPPSGGEIFGHPTGVVPAETAGDNPPAREGMQLGPLPPGGLGANHYPFAAGPPRLPPIFQVEKRQVTTSATQAASVSRRRNQATFFCPVPGCGSSFTRRFNLRGHLRSHTEERPYVCEYPGCKKGFARQHDCKRHQALHAAKTLSNVCGGCNKPFSRMDALNRHLRSENGAECRQKIGQQNQATSASSPKQEPLPDSVPPPSLDPSLS
jgi:hypothetical protein